MPWYYYCFFSRIKKIVNVVCMCMWKQICLELTKHHNLIALSSLHSLYYHFIPTASLKEHTYVLACVAFRETKSRRVNQIYALLHLVFGEQDKSTNLCTRTSLHSLQIIFEMIFHRKSQPPVCVYVTTCVYTS